eukprot:TRINITY_DN1021_c0_g1_i1.p2 TRINITY_DN1021_c0_g1~~TRINITY_DN1021_c0_g1_i1.p2  ORF type:complete len:102 (+),score=22.47 TRINITY_DN1021_c0_g1_i1:106-411(+)
MRMCQNVVQQKKEQKMNLKVILVLVAMSVMIVSACVPPDCDNNDCGSCGNGCCKLLWSVESGMDFKDVANAIVNATHAGGPDERYAFVTANPDYAVPGTGE